MTEPTPFAHPRLRTSTDGTEKFCAKCDEWWPADLEFFFNDPGGAVGLFYCCKACYREHLDPRRLKIGRAQKDGLIGRSSKSGQGLCFDGAGVVSEGLNEPGCTASSSEVILKCLFRNPGDYALPRNREDCEVHAAEGVNSIGGHGRFQEQGRTV